MAKFRHQSQRSHTCRPATYIRPRRVSCIRQRSIRKASAEVRSLGSAPMAEEVRIENTAHRAKQFRCKCIPTQPYLLAFGNSNASRLLSLINNHHFGDRITGDEHGASAIFVHKRAQVDEHDEQPVELVLAVNVWRDLKAQTSTVSADDLA